MHHPTFGATQADAEAQLAGKPLLLASPALREVTVDTYGDAPAVNILAGLQHHVHTYESRRGIAAFTGRDQTYRRHRYDDRGALPLATKQSLAPRFSQGIGAPGGPFFTAFDFNVALLRRCVTEARARGYEVLLMQDPLDTTAAGDTFATYQAKYQPQVERIVDSTQAHYVDLNKTAVLVDGDFFDLFHLLGSGRDKWTAKLGASLAEIVGDHVSTAAVAVPPRSSSAPGVPAKDPAAPAAEDRLPGCRRQRRRRCVEHQRRQGREEGPCQRQGRSDRRWRLAGLADHRGRARDRRHRALPRSDASPRRRAAAGARSRRPALADAPPRANPATSPSTAPLKQVGRRTLPCPTRRRRSRCRAPSSKRRFRARGADRGGPVRPGAAAERPASIPVWTRRFWGANGSAQRRGKTPM